VLEDLTVDGARLYRAVHLFALAADLVELIEL
jgi:hypothetical protein